MLPICFLFRNYDYYLLRFQYHLVIQWDALEMHSSGIFLYYRFPLCVHTCVCVYVHIHIFVRVHVQIEARGQPWVWSLFAFDFCDNHE